MKRRENCGNMEHVFFTRERIEVVNVPTVCANFHFKCVQKYRSASSLIRTQCEEKALTSSVLCSLDAD